jgi:hypothetical protein
MKVARWAAHTLCPVHLILFSHATSGQLLDSFVPQFPHLQMWSQQWLPLGEIANDCNNKSQWPLLSEAVVITVSADHGMVLAKGMFYILLPTDEMERAQSRGCGPGFYTSLPWVGHTEKGRLGVVPRWDASSSEVHLKVAPWCQLWSVMETGESI